MQGLEVWLQVMTAFASAGAFLLSVYALLTARNRKDVADLLASRARHEARLVKVENDVAHLPDIETAHELRLSIAEIKGQIAVIVERVGPIKAIAERLQESMLEGHR